MVRTLHDMYLLSEIYPRRSVSEENFLRAKKPADTPSISMRKYQLRQ